MTASSRTLVGYTSEGFRLELDGDPIITKFDKRKCCWNLRYILNESCVAVI